MSQKSRRHILGVFDFGLREFAEGLKHAINDPMRPVIGSGLFDHISMSGLRSTLRCDGHIFTLVMRGKDKPEWLALDAAQSEEAVTPFGVVVLKGNGNVWQRLAGYQRISFVLDADRVKSREELESLFPHLAGTKRVASVEHAALPEILKGFTAGDFDPLSGPYRH